MYAKGCVLDVTEGQEVGQVWARYSFRPRMTFSLLYVSIVLTRYFEAASTAAAVIRFCKVCMYVRTRGETHASLLRICCYVFAYHTTSRTPTKEKPTKEFNSKGVTTTACSASPEGFLELLWLLLL